jgi:hypothetical protein
MGVAIISAVGVLVAALITVVVSLITANERSARLLREAETLSKLEPGSEIYKHMERRLEISITRYGIDADHKWNSGDRLWFALGGLGAGFAGIVWAYVYSRFDVQSWRNIYYWVAVAIIVVGTWCTWENVSPTVKMIRQRRKKNSESEE